MTDSKALIEQATRRAAILHASAAWGSDEDGALIDRLLDHIEVLETHNEGYKLALAEQLQIRQQLEADNARLREALEWYIAEDAKYIRAALQETSHDRD